MNESSYNNLTKYEEISRQKINKEKSAIYLHGKVSMDVVIIAAVVIGISRKEFPFTYLGCLTFYMRKLKAYYRQLIHKVSTNL